MGKSGARDTAATPSIAFAGGPTLAGPAHLVASGFRSVLAVRRREEDILEGALQRALDEIGLAHAEHVLQDGLAPQALDDARTRLAALPRPVLVWSRDRTTSGAIALADAGIRDGLAGKQVIERAHELGLDLAAGGLAELVRDYVDDHRVGTPAARSTLGRVATVAAPTTPSAPLLARATGRFGPERGTDAARVREWLGGGDHGQDEAQRRELAESRLPPLEAQASGPAPGEVDALRLERPGRRR